MNWNRIVGIVSWVALGIGIAVMAKAQTAEPSEDYMRGVIDGIVATWDDLGPKHDGCVGGAEFGFYRELLKRDDRSISAVARSFRAAFGRCTEDDV